MERYYDNNRDDDPEPFFGSYDDDDEEDEDEEEAIAFIDQDGLLDVMEMNIAQSELAHGLLDKAIKIAKQSWFWRFKSANAKMNEIEVIYNRLVKMMEDEGEKGKEPKEE